MITHRLVTLKPNSHSSGSFLPTCIKNLLHIPPTFTLNNRLNLHRPIPHSISTARSPIRLRGNQRDRDRERAQARAGGKSKQTKTDGLTPEQRRERDAKALQEKLARKEAKDAAGAKGGKDGVKIQK